MPRPNREPPRAPPAPIAPPAPHDPEPENRNRKTNGFHQAVTRDARGTSEDEKLTLPGTAPVRSFVQSAGSTVTFQCVARDVLERLEAASNSKEIKQELRFVINCLNAGHDKMNLSCAMMIGDADKTESVRENLLQTMSSVAKPVTATPNLKKEQTSTSEKPASKDQPKKSTSTVIQSRGALNFVDKSKEAVPLNACPWMGPAVPKWPVNDLNSADTHKLQNMLENFNSWHFDIFALHKLTQGRSLQFAGWQALCNSGCFSEFPLDPKKVSAFLAAAEPLYLPEGKTSYHNLIHAADVTQSLNSLLTDVGLGIYFDPMDYMVAIVSAIIHDMGHDGRNNAFHVNSQDSLALTYNDKSVLENYHLSLAFKLMVGYEPTNMLDGLSKEQVTVVRKEVIDMVLGTDMSQHFNSVGDFTDLVSRIGTKADDWQKDQRAMFVLRSMVLHSADISNQAKPYSMAYSWSMRVLAEFFAQGDEEKDHGLPVSPLCDRATTDVPRSQTGFIQFIVQPTFEGLANLVPRVKDVCVCEIKGNLLAWEKRKELADAEAANPKAN